MSSPRKEPISDRQRRVQLVERLAEAANRLAVAQGDAQWTQGYRAAKGEPEESRLYGKEMRQWAKEMRQWAYVTSCERRFRNLAKRALLEVSR